MINFSSNVEQMVKAFHQKYKCVMAAKPTLPAKKTVALRKRLLKEEVKELCKALDEGNLAHIAKEACDVVYVVVGILVTYGIPFIDVFQAVHSSNMTKTGDTRGDGKILKGPDYIPPDSYIEHLLKEK